MPIDPDVQPYLDDLSARVAALEGRPAGALPGVVCVTDHGAVGDGVADDTAAIQAALDAGQGQTVWFPRGAYRVTDRGDGRCLDLSALSHLHLAGPGGSRTNPGGEGGAATVFSASAGVTVMACEPAALNHNGPCVEHLRLEDRAGDCDLFTVRDANNYVFRNVTFRGYGTAGATAGTGLKITASEDSSYGHLFGCSFVRNGTGLSGQGSAGFYVSGGYSNANRANHVLMDFQGGCYATTVVGHKFESTGAAGAVGVRSSAANGVQLLGNQFEGCPTGVHLADRAVLTDTQDSLLGNSFDGQTATEVGVYVGVNRRETQLLGNRWHNLGTMVVDNGANTVWIGALTTGQLAGMLAKLGGVYLGAGSAAPSAPAADGSLYLRKGVGVYKRQSGAWTQL